MSTREKIILCFVILAAGYAAYNFLADKRDPFLKPGPSVKFGPESGQAGVSAEELSFTYSGYLEMADKKLAIINGIEYKAGEMIVNGGGYIVSSIFPTRVALELIGGKNRITLPLEELNIPSLDKTQ
jgi:hypothetical protein